MRSASSVDQHSEKFTGRKMVSASGCQCSGFSNAHGLGRFCHPWEDPMQEAWCYVLDNCSSATSRGSFGRRYESCEAPPPTSNEEDEYLRQQSATYQEQQDREEQMTSVLQPASGCNCSGYESSLGFGRYCHGWEYAGQTPWCYIDRACQLAGSSASAPRWALTSNGSFGQPYEECVWKSEPGGAGAAPLEPARRRHARHARRRLAEKTTPPTRGGGGGPAAPARGGHRSPLHSLLASAPEMERYVVLISAASHTFLHVEAPPHKDALRLTAKSDELSVRAVFSSYEHTRLILSLATNALLNVEEESGIVTTGTKRGGEQRRLLRMPRRTARWAIERVHD